MNEAKLSVRCRPGNADHHLWDNNGTFWCHLTVHFADFTKRRLRLSLDTADVRHARQLRDSLLALFGVRPVASLAAVPAGQMAGKEVV
jgi:hypothetical protein